MAPEYGATAAMFFIDETTDYLRLTGRSDEQVKLVETTRRPPGRGPTRCAQYERVLTFDLSSVVRNMAGPSNPHKPCRPPTWPRAASPASGKRSRAMPDGAVIIAAITSCTNTSNPRNVIAAACWRATRTRAA
jgi:aconitate hydratase